VVSEILDLLLSGLSRDPILRLDLTHEHVPLASNLVKFIIRELTPRLLPVNSFQLP
jgi:hypothetical protein